METKLAIAIQSFKGNLVELFLVAVVVVLLSVKSLLALAACIQLEEKATQSLKIITII